MFSNNNIPESILSVFSLGAGAVSIAMNDGILTILGGVALFVIGTLGLIFGNW